MKHHQRSAPNTLPEQADLFAAHATPKAPAKTKTSAALARIRRTEPLHVRGERIRAASAAVLAAETGMERATVQAEYETQWPGLLTLMTAGHQAWEQLEPHTHDPAVLRTQRLILRNLAAHIDAMDNAVADQLQETA